MFNISEIIPLNDGRFRLQVETDDASLFGLVCIFESLVEFSVSFRHKMGIAKKVDALDASRPARMEKARVERQAILFAYEQLQGSRKEKLHFLRDQLKEQGMERITLDGVISILTMARKEKGEVAENVEKKSA